MSLRNALRRWVASGLPPVADGVQWAARGRLARRRSGIERALWTVVVLAMTADIVLTHVGRQVGLVELNPVARDALQTWGLSGLVALKAGALGIGVSLRALLPRRYTVVVPLALAVPTVPAVVSNVVVIAVAVA